MTYYEELGVDPGASVEDIRRAYKRLTRLLHPDHQQDPALRDLADRQMLRLNHILSLLVDPVRRADYDRQLSVPGSGVEWPPPGVTPGLRCAPSASRRFSPPRSAGWYRSAWILLAPLILFLLGAAWLIPPGSTPVVPQSSFPAAPPAAPAATPPAVARVAPAARTSAAPPAASRSRPRAPRADVPPHPVVQVPAIPLSPVPIDSVPAPRAATVAVNPPPPPPAPAPPVPSLVGRWIFARSPGDPTDPKLYPPDFIELRITARDGRLRGDYRARYVVADRPISPSVNFSFDGPAAHATPAEFEWQAGGGARGRVTLRLRSLRSLEVSWFATEMGAELGLGSGAATLFRQE